MNKFNQTTIDTLGGLNPVRAMTGCKVLVDDSNNDITLFEVKGSKYANTVKVHYNQGSDLYDVTFYKVKGHKLTVVAKSVEVFGSDLKRHIEEKLKLSLTL